MRDISCDLSASNACMDESRPLLGNPRALCLEHEGAEMIEGAQSRFDGLAVEAGGSR